MCKTGLDTDVIILITALYVYQYMSVGQRVMLKKEDFDMQQSCKAVVQYDFFFFYDECRRAGGTERRNCGSLVA